MSLKGKDNNYKGRAFKERKNYPFRHNFGITSPDVRIILPDGQSKIEPTPTAIKIAKEMGMDLIEISPKSQPPVCKIIEIGKYLYEENKRLKNINHKSKHKVKEIDLHITIAAHDLETKLKAAKKFLADHHSLIIKVVYRKRENAHPEIGLDLLKRVQESLKDYGTTDQNPKKAGTMAILRLNPKTHTQKKEKMPLDIAAKSI